MALQGTYTKYISSISETEFDTVSHTYPLALPSDHPDYEKRGTTEERSIPREILTPTIYENVYLIITGTTIEKHINGWTLGYAYRLYNAPEDASSINPTDDKHVYDYTQSMGLDATDFPTNPVEAAYEHLKTLPECSNMTNA